MLHNHECANRKQWKGKWNNIPPILSIIVNDVVNWTECKHFNPSQWSSNQSTAFSACETKTMALHYTCDIKWKVWWTVTIHNNNYRWKLYVITPWNMDKNWSKEDISWIRIINEKYFNWSNSNSIKWDEVRIKYDQQYLVY